MEREPSMSSLGAQFIALASALGEIRELGRHPFSLELLQIKPARG